MKPIKSTSFLLYLILCLGIFTVQTNAQLIVSYAYDQAGNRISRKIVNLTINPNPSHVKKNNEPLPIEDKPGERKITIYPNPTKGHLGVDINGGDPKEELAIILYNAQGVTLRTMEAQTGITSVDLSAYPNGWYILRVQAGSKWTEYKIIKN